MNAIATVCKRSTTDEVADRVLAAADLIRFHRLDVLSVRYSRSPDSCWVHVASPLELHRIGGEVTREKFDHEYNKISADVDGIVFFCLVPVTEALGT